MKKTIRFSLLIVIIFTFVSCSTSRNMSDRYSVLPLSDNNVIREGSIIYGLPRTVFTVVVEMERTIEIPGPYSKYAANMLGLENVIKNENESWSVENISIRSDEELDPSEFYVIKSNTLFQSNVLSLKKEGLILDLNPAMYNSSGRQDGNKESGSGQFRSYDLGSDEYFKLQRDTAYKRVNLDSSFIRIPYIVEKMRRLSTDQLAEKAAKRLMEMRDGKHLILTGEANVFPQNEAALDEMNRLEREYTELFTGKTYRERRVFTYQIIPGREMLGKPVVLFRFSDMTGPVSASMKGGSPVTIEFVPEQKTKALTVLNNTQPDREGKKYDKLYYRVPDIADVTISMGQDVLFSSRRLVYQFGQVIQLPSNYIIGK